MAGRFQMAGYPEVIQRLRGKRQAYFRVARDTLRTAIVQRSTVLETAPCVQKEMAGVGAHLRLNQTAIYRYTNVGPPRGSLCCFA